LQGLCGAPQKHRKCGVRHNKTVLQKIFLMSSLPPYSEDWKIVRAFIESIDSDLKASKTTAVPILLQEMLISGEDHRFFNHPGYDIRAILRAAYRTMIGHPEGGSTIAQQLARIATGRFERSIRRKVREIRLAASVTREFPRSRLPAIYLLSAYYGWRMNGLEQAYRRLGYIPEKLSANQAAGLVARLKYPEPRFAPPRREQLIARRTKHLVGLHQSHSAQYSTNSLTLFT
jgi:membrane peptidoglycan carboxypeptidase